MTQTAQRPTYKGVYIDGGWRPVEETSASFDTENPHSGDKVLRVHPAEREQVEQAVQAAHRAWPAWRALGLEGRKEALLRLKGELTRRREDIALAISSEMGKLYSEGLAEADACAGKIDITLGEAAERVADVHPPGLTGGFWTYRPHGVMAVIGPYNFPIHLANGHIIAALMTGNTVVFKPSSITPWVGQVYTEALHDAGFPAGVFNLLPMTRAAGDALVTHQLVRGILFTGSWSVGLHFKKLTLEDPHKILALEMGGKNSVIVADDAHFEQTVSEILTGAYLTTGQRCTGTARVIATPRHYQRLEEALAVGAERIQSGDPFGEGVFMGPLASRGAFRTFSRDLEIAESPDSGLSPLVGFKQAGGVCGVGACLHRVDRYDPHHPYLREEVFGPALTIERVDDLDSAFARAQETDYGLAFSIFTESEATFRRALEDVPSGIVNWNRATNGASGRLPFGGTGKSGNHRPAALFAPEYCAYPVASLSKPFGQVDRTPCPGFPQEVWR
jgi:succinylglutamic semialdehyde dehydrogenase